MRMPSSASSGAGTRCARATSPAPTSGSASARWRPAAASGGPAHGRAGPSRRERDAMVAAARWASSKWRAQLLLYLSAYWAYSATRWIAAGDVPKAKAHAHWIARVEQTLHVGVEGSVQRALDSGAPIWVLNHLYFVAQFAVVPGALIWLYAHAPAIYRTLRNTVLATWLMAVPVYALYPVAP